DQCPLSDWVLTEARGSLRILVPETTAVTQSLQAHGAALKLVNVLKACYIQRFHFGTVQRIT
ncbi:MAG: hypothetical protein ACKPKO_54955, partial [Candidatus Fonsibacter sp.]